MKNVHVISTASGVLFKTCEVDNFFGSVLNEIRTQKGLSEKELADSLKISVQELNSYEGGFKKPLLNMLLNIAKVLQVDPFDLINQSLDKSKYFSKSTSKSLSVQETNKKASRTKQRKLSISNIASS